MLEVKPLSAYGSVGFLCESSSLSRIKIRKSPCSFEFGFFLLHWEGWQVKAKEVAWA
jgi:hypothetical protein